MGRSQTIHVVGLGEPGIDGAQRMFYAMSRAEMAQQVEIARRFEHINIVSWYSQTKTGEKMTERGPSTRLKRCRICNGKARYGTVVRYDCPVCRGSGLSMPGNEKRWNDWQIREMKKEFEAA